MLSGSTLCLVFIALASVSAAHATSGGAQVENPRSGRGSRETGMASPPLVVVLLGPTASQTRYALVSGAGRLLRSPDLAFVGVFQQDGLQGFVAPAQLAGGGWGFVDGTGQWVVEPTLEGAKGFAGNGLARVKAEGLWGFVNRQGQRVIPPAFLEVRPFRHGVAAVSDRQGWHYVAEDGERAFDGTWRAASDFAANGLAPAVALGSEQWGYIDRSGEVAIPAIYGAARPFGPDGLAPVSVDGYDDWHLIDAAGRRVSDEGYSTLEEFGEEGLAHFSRWTSTGAEYGFLDAEGKEVVADRDALGVIGCGLIRIGLGKMGFRSLTGEEAIPADYFWAAPFRQECATVARSSRDWGVLRSDGRFIPLPPGTREPLTNHDGLVIGFQRTPALLPVVGEGGSVIFLGADGASAFSARVEEERWTLWNRAGELLWRGERVEGLSPVVARLETDHREAFVEARFWDGDLRQAVEELLEAEGHDLVIPEDPEVGFIDPDDRSPESAIDPYEGAHRVYLRLLARSRVGEELAARFEYLEAQRHDSFVSYFETLSKRLDESYPAVEEGAPNLETVFGDGEQKAYRAGGRILILAWSALFGDGDFEYRLWLAIVD